MAKVHSHASFAICGGNAARIQSSTGKDAAATPVAAFMKKKKKVCKKRHAASFSKLSRGVGSLAAPGGAAPLRLWEVACLFLR